MITSAARDSAERYVDRLAEACRLGGLVTEIVEPAAKLKIAAKGGPALMAEIVSLGVGADAGLTWHWSWGSPICAAGDIDLAVRSIRHVVSGGQ